MIRKMRGETANAVRKYVAEHYIDPVRERGLQQVDVRAGDVHKTSGYDVPLICSSLRAKQFRRQCGLELVSVTNPPNSTSTTFTFRLMKSGAAGRSLRTVTELLHACSGDRI